MIRRSTLHYRAAALAPGRTPKPTTSRDFLEQAESRARARLIAESLQRDQEIEDFKSRALPSASRSPLEELSTDELLELDRANLRERHINDQQKKTLGAVATWLVSHSEVPATPEAGAKLAEYCQARGWNTTWNTLETAYAALLASGEITPNYTKANRDAHEAHADILRARGIRVDAVDPGQFDNEQVAAFSGGQPAPLLEDAYLEDTTPETTYEPPKVPTFSDFE